MDLKTLNEELISLPVEERIILADLLLKSLNPSGQNIEKQWLDVAQTRLDEIKNGKSKLINADIVFKEILEQFEI